MKMNRFGSGLRLVVILCLAGLLFGLSGCGKKELSSAEYQFEALSPDKSSPLLNWDEMERRNIAHDDVNPSFSGFTEVLSLKSRFKMTYEFDLSDQRVDDQQEYQNLWLEFTTNVKEKEPEKGTYMFIPLAGAPDFYNGNGLGRIGVDHDDLEFSDFAGKHIVIEAKYSDRKFMGEIYADGVLMNTFSSSSFDADGSRNKTFRLCGNNVVIQNATYTMRNTMGFWGILLLALIQFPLTIIAEGLDEKLVNEKRRKVIGRGKSCVISYSMMYVFLNVLYHQNTELFIRWFDFLKDFGPFLGYEMLIAALVFAAIALIIILIKAKFQGIFKIFLHLLGSMGLRAATVIILVIIGKSLYNYSRTGLYIFAIILILKLLLAYLEIGDTDDPEILRRRRAARASSFVSRDSGGSDFEYPEYHYPDKIIDEDSNSTVLYLSSNDGNYAVYHDGHGNYVTIHGDLTDDANARYREY